MAVSDHRPVLLAVNLSYRLSNPNPSPDGNTRKVAGRRSLSRLTNEYCKTVKVDHFNINRPTDSFIQSILRAASETIPCGARKNYRPNWTEELQGLEDEGQNQRKG